MKNFKRTVWVGFDRKHGFLKGKTMPSYTDDFSKARLYSRRCDVLNSATRGRYRDGDVVPIPIEMNLEEEVAMIIRLGGTVVEDDK